jgi:hypothetical protein
MIEDPGPDPEGARAASLWVIYVLIHLGDFAEAAAELNDDRYARAVVVLSRTTYEYLISMIYLFRHSDIADKQMLTQGARLYKRGVGMTIGLGHDLSKQYQEAYAAWLEDAGGSGLNEFTGNFKFLTAALEIEGETKEQCPKYTLRYGVTSAVAHPDAEGFPDTFCIDNEATTIKIAWLSSFHSFDVLFLIAQDLVRALTFLQDEVGIVIPKLAEIQNRMKNIASEHFDV